MYQYISCQSYYSYSFETQNTETLIVDKKKPQMLVVLTYQLEPKAIHYFHEKSILNVWLSSEHASTLMF